MYLIMHWFARIPVSASQKTTRPLSISSISSEDSVNLDELIKANYTSDMDDETDLPDLATLDLDDSDEEFWKLDEVGTQTILNVANNSRTYYCLIRLLFMHIQNPSNVHVQEALAVKIA